jgi:CarD family transcriptional regulator
MTSKKKTVKKSKPVAKPKAKIVAPPPKAVPAKLAPPLAKIPVKATIKRSDIAFKVGDHVVYPTHGVGQIKEVQVQEIAGHRLELFVIAFERDRMVLKVPIPKVVTSGLRKLSSRKMMETALATLKGRARIKRTMWSRRAQEYEAKINSGDPIAIAEVIRDLHRNVGQPDQSFSERQIYEAARDRLATELAAVERTSIEQATTKLEGLLAAV